jgi:hypothetical protein
MKIRFAMGVALGLLLLAAGGAASAEQKKLIGTTTSVDAATGSIAVAESNGMRAMTFHVGKKSRVTDRSGRKGLALDALTPGSAVSVTYDDAGETGGDPEVRHMQVTLAPPASEAAPEE